MKTILIAAALMLSMCAVGCAGQTPRIQPAEAGIDTDAAEAHAAFSRILSTHVRDGRVDYPTLCRSGHLEAYLARLEATDPAAITDDHTRLAFWINAYNAFTLQLICENYPVKSINDLHFAGRYVGAVTKKTIWHRDFIVINGEKLSLNDIEHEIIRPRFQDPRAHFALVCASKSCPALSAQAFEGPTLNSQLDEQARIFFAEPGKNHFDTKEKVAHISKILDWYAGDFGANDEEILLFVARYLPDGVAAVIRRDPAGWKIKHTHYDWSLNE
ncbi:MAG: DUF547 domain-containing protein [Candidatus Krumholzibacteria bacterium]